MTFAHIKEIEGKTIQTAQLWPDDEGVMSLQLEFEDGSSICLTVNPPKPKNSLEITIFSEFARDWKSGKDITEKIMKRAK